MLWFNEHGPLEKGERRAGGGVRRGASHGGTMVRHAREPPCAWSPNRARAWAHPPASVGSRPSGAAARPRGGHATARGLCRERSGLAGTGRSPGTPGTTRRRRARDGGNHARGDGARESRGAVRSPQTVDTARRWRRPGARARVTAPRPLTGGRERREGWMGAGGWSGARRVVGSSWHGVGGAAASARSTWGQEAWRMARGRRQPSAGRRHQADRGRLSARHASHDTLADQGRGCRRRGQGAGLDPAVVERCGGR